MTTGKPRAPLALCQSCGKQGRLLDVRKKPSWCKCRRKGGGPFVAPPDHVTRYHFGRKRASVKP